MTKRFWIISGLVLTAGWVSIPIYLLNVLVERGINADETHTSGYTTDGEILLMIISVVMFIATIVFFAKALMAPSKKA